MGKSWEAMLMSNNFRHVMFSAAEASRARFIVEVPEPASNTRERARNCAWSSVKLVELLVEQPRAGSHEDAGDIIASKSQSGFRCALHTSEAQHAWHRWLHRGCCLVAPENRPFVKVPMSSNCRQKTN